MTRAGIILLALLGATGALAQNNAECMPLSLNCSGGTAALPICGPGVHGSCIVPMSGDGGVTDGHDWHLLTVSYGGTVSLLKGLTKQECEYSRARALGLPATPEEEQADAERYKNGHPACPARSATKEEWATWQAEHMTAQGCNYADGSSESVDWGGGHAIFGGDIKSAECFQ